MRVVRRPVSWLPDLRSLPTFQPRNGRGRRGEFSSRSQLRDSPGFAPVFPFGVDEATRRYRRVTKGPALTPTGGRLPDRTVRFFPTGRRVIVSWSTSRRRLAGR